MSDNDRNSSILAKANKLDKMKIVVYVLGGMVAILALFSWILLKDGVHEEQGYVLLIISIIAAIVLVFVGDLIMHNAKKLKCTYKKWCQEELVPAVLQSIFDSVVYNYESGFSFQYILDLDLLRMPWVPLMNIDNFVESWNYVQAEYKGISFKCADMKIRQPSGTGTGPIYYFYGRIMELHSPSYASTKLKIYSRNLRHAKDELFPHKLEKIQMTGVETFDNKFQMRCDSDELFKTIMTSEMMEKLELFHHLYDKFAMEFYNDKLYVAMDIPSWLSDSSIYSYMKPESFEPDYSWGSDYQYQFYKIKKDTRFITDVIDIFCRG